jgi:ribosomal protein S27E
MEVKCGMCGDEVTVVCEDANGVLCKPCEDYTAKYLHPNEGGT